MCRVLCFYVRQVGLRYLGNPLGVALVLLEIVMFAVAFALWHRRRAAPSPARSPAMDGPAAATPLCAARAPTPAMYWLYGGGLLAASVLSPSAVALPLYGALWHLLRAWLRSPRAVPRLPGGVLATVRLPVLVNLKNHGRFV